jgi:nucleotide-binding universal stress UspA family protein
MTTEPSRTILCGTDFTETARDAIDLAASLAGALHARLEVVHVFDASGPPWRDEQARSRAVAAAATALEEEVTRTEATHGVPVMSRVLTGSPATRLTELAAEVGAMLIVVAAKGPTPSIFRVGGTAERVAQAARTPVLLVRDARPIRAWLRGDHLSVAALVGDEAASDHVIDWLRAMRRIGACDVSVLHAYYVDEAARRLGLTARPLVVADPEIEGYLHRDLQRRVGDLGGRGLVEIYPVLALGRQADHLIEHPAARGTGLVVVGNHRARGIARLSSVAAGIVHLAESSVLVVPADAPAVADAPWPRFQRLLVATDFSSFAADAIRHAYGLAAAGKGEIVILHVLTAPSDGTTIAESCAALRRLVPAQPPPGVVSRVEAIFDGDAAAGILHTAARLGADCVVIASHGRSGLRKVFLGSVAQGVVQGSHRPVLIVRPPADA